MKGLINTDYGQIVIDEAEDQSRHDDAKVPGRHIADRSVCTEQGHDRGGAQSDQRTYDKRKYDAGTHAGADLAL